MEMPPLEALVLRRHLITVQEYRAIQLSKTKDFATVHIVRRMLYCALVADFTGQTLRPCGCED